LALLEAVGERSPGLLVGIEDLHWADASTRDLVTFLARHLRTAKVALVIPRARSRSWKQLCCCTTRNSSGELTSAASM
jgi:hypothetical protein